MVGNSTSGTFPMAEQEQDDAASSVPVSFSMGCLLLTGLIVRLDASMRYA